MSAPALLLLVEVCVVVAADICFMLLFLTTAKLREGPGQLILAQTQTQIIIDLHWLIWFDEKIMKSESTCKPLVFFAFLGFVMSCTYTAAICVAVSLHFDKHKYPSLWRYHVAVLVISVALSLIFLEQVLFFDHCYQLYCDNRGWTK